MGRRHRPDGKHDSHGNAHGQQRHVDWRSHWTALPVVQSDRLGSNCLQTLHEEHRGKTPADLVVEVMTLMLASVFRMADGEVETAFREMRWDETANVRATPLRKRDTRMQPLRAKGPAIARG
jgi:hypothetical protein